ncbi:MULTISPECIES: type II toxin-antitoxin system YafQ family toxin [unclassified Bartonella]|uniref:type II toxin-antitoxin system YafQ family toxin n=1 Tax=Bartonella TaxID=773 RepID=UPI00235E508E|nr:type II toxin-antitoxin system YafQ family toxin [Bartonella sp. AU18XJBT]
MREIISTKLFRRDVKREKKGKHAYILKTDLLLVIETLAKDKPLEVRFKDHRMIGAWRGWHDCYNCHIKPDLILLYRKPETNTLELLRLGSHSELRI